MRGAVGVIARGEVPGDALRGADPVLHAGAAIYLLLIGLLVVVAALEQVIERRDDAHAHTVVVQRDVPKPALPVGGLDHHGGAFIASGVAVGAFPVGPDGALVQSRIPDAQFELVLDQAALAAGVDHNLGAHFADRPVGKVADL